MNHPLPENTPPIPSTRPDILSGNRIFFRSQKVRNPAFLLIPHLVRTGNIFNRDLLWFSHPGNRMKDADSEKLAISHLPAICNHDSYTKKHLQPYINIQATICIQYTRHARRSSLHLPPPPCCKAKKEIPCNHHPVITGNYFWSSRPDLNRRPARYECAALPTEPRKHLPAVLSQRRI